MTRWILADLAGRRDLAAEWGLGASAVGTWLEYADFPPPVVILSGGPVFSRRQVADWRRQRWPDGRPAAGRGRQITPDPPTPVIQGRRWDLDDLAAPGDIQRRWAAAKATPYRWLRRPGAPGPLMTLAFGPVYSYRQVTAWRDGGERSGSGDAPSQAVRAPDLRYSQRADRYHQVADELAARIAAGEYPPGTRLPSRGALAAEYGVGVGGIARVTAILRDRGLVEPQRSRGTIVIAAPAL